MARQIKETPVLTAEQARKFHAEVKRNESNKVPADNYRRAMEAYRKIKIVQG